MIKSESEDLRKYRKKMFLTAYPLKTAHIASAFSIAEIMYVLYKKVLKFDINSPWWKDRDRFILSKGHASLAQYVMLNEINLLSDEKLKSFCLPGDSIGGEANPMEAIGVEATTGSLGHGLGIGVGMAMALKMDNSPARVFVVVGNGELNEGVMWESIMSAYKFELDNLIVILDNNKLQKMGFTSETMRINSWKEKFLAFGWSVDEIDGHNLNEIYFALTKKNEQSKPRIIIANTIKGKGVSIIENKADWHWRMPNKRELEYFKQELNISEKELEECKKRI